MTKQCVKCKEIKDLDKFVKRNDRKSGIGSICKMCVNERCKLWNKRNRDRVLARARELYKQNDGMGSKNSQLKRMYGITLDQYNKMLVDQSNKCAICGKEQLKYRRRLSVDHCHETNKVRGLLCHPCNAAFGLLQENMDIILNMANYAKKHLTQDLEDSKAK